MSCFLVSDIRMMHLCWLVMCLRVRRPPVLVGQGRAAVTVRLFLYSIRLAMLPVKEAGLFVFCES